MRRALLARIEKTHVRMPFFGHLQINVAARQIDEIASVVDRQPGFVFIAEFF
jgi:hypothetical protein